MTKGSSVLGARCGCGRTLGTPLRYGPAHSHLQSGITSLLHMVPPSITLTFTSFDRACTPGIIPTTCAPIKLAELPESTSNNTY